MLRETKNKRSYLEMSKELGKELGIKPEVIYAVMKSEFSFIKSHIESFELDEMESADELDNIRCSFNLKRIGKFTIPKDKFIRWRRQKEYLEKDGRVKD